MQKDKNFYAFSTVRGYNCTVEIPPKPTFPAKAAF